MRAVICPLSVVAVGTPLATEILEEAEVRWGMTSSAARNQLCGFMIGDSNKDKADETFIVSKA